MKDLVSIRWCFYFLLLLLLLLLFMCPLHLLISLLNDLLPFLSNEHFSSIHLLTFFLFNKIYMSLFKWSGITIEVMVLLRLVLNGVMLNQELNYEVGRNCGKRQFFILKFWGCNTFLLHFFSVLIFPHGTELKEESKKCPNTSEFLKKKVFLFPNFIY